MKNLFAKSLYEHSEGYNKIITCKYSEIALFKRLAWALSFRSIHRRRFILYSKKKIPFDILMAFRRVIGNHYSLTNLGLFLEPKYDDVVLTETIVDNKYNTFEYEYEFQIIKNWKKDWLDDLRRKREAND
jgi:hypothetical protein